MKKTLLVRRQARVAAVRDGRSQREVARTVRVALSTLQWWISERENGVRNRFENHVSW